MDERPAPDRFSIWADKHEILSGIQANQRYYSTTACKYDQINGPRHRMRRSLERMVSGMIAEGRPPSRVLDIGTGTGFAISTVAPLLASNASTFVGCDISDDMLNVAKSRIPGAQFMSFDGVQLPFGKGSFDLVMLVSVIHHIRDPFPLLSEAVRVLSPGGRLIVLQEPNPVINGIVRRIRIILGMLHDQTMALAEYHQMITNGIAPPNVVAWLRESGLDPRIEYSNAALLDALVARFGRAADRLLAPLMWLRSARSCLCYSVVA